MRYADVTPGTPADQIRTILSARPSDGDAWPSGFHAWDNVRDAHADLMRVSVRRLRFGPREKEGSGVVLYGGGRYLPSAYVTVRAIRHAGYPGPIEMFYLGEHGEMDAFHDRLFADLGVEPRDASAIPERADRRLFGGWPLKPFALRHCRFRHAVAFDADCYPAARDPVRLVLESDQYRRHGAFFLPDQLSFDLKPEVWSALRMSDEACWSFESGFMAIDTVRHWREVALAQHVNDHHDFYYNLFWGDKESFAVSWRRLGGAYFQPPFRWCKVEHSMVHYWLDGRPIVVHRCEDKFTVVDDRAGMNLFWNTNQGGGRNRFVPQLPFEVECFGWLREYRELLSRAGGSRAVGVKTGVEGFAIEHGPPLRHPLADRADGPYGVEVYRPRRPGRVCP